MKKAKGLHYTTGDSVGKNIFLEEVNRGGVAVEAIEVSNVSGADFVPGLAGYNGRE
ncbi:MAG: hypothetical protein PHV34_01105 [Verrucomicrobiae bacterium]|nr:hypothetical protein [Verrucomicrobiae bacterium]